MPRKTREFSSCEPHHGLRHLEREPRRTDAFPGLPIAEAELLSRVNLDGGMSSLEREIAPEHLGEMRDEVRSLLAFVSGADSRLLQQGIIAQGGHLLLPGIVFHA